MLLSASAKINLDLRILGRREDGFHEVETRMCLVSVADKILLEPRKDGKTLFQCSDPAVPADESNLALRALRAFEETTGIRKGWNIQLQKNIPHGAGLGGGSSDAAAVLRGLNESSGHPLTLDELERIAGSLGSDIPFFLHGKVCDARGRGERVEPVSFPWTLPLVLVKPPFGIASSWAYSRWKDSRELPGVLYAPQLCEWGAMVNHLERPAFEKWTLLAALKQWLLDQPETRAALMSGSGSTVFAVTRDGAGAALLADRVQAWCGASTWVRVARTLGGPEPDQAGVIAR